MLPAADRAKLLSHARDSVRAAAAGKPATPPPLPAGSPFGENSGAFVTLHGPEGLRGCIGYIEARHPLWTTVWDAARQACIDDPRFDPVRPDEVDRLEIEISVLGPLKPGDAASVRVGVHGILLTRGPRRGLLLPQVATEHGWDAERFLDAGCDKAGLPRGAWKDGGAKLEVFEAEVFGS